ncbi:hypothetical protein [Streptomyces sp. NPDC046870]
MSHPRTAADARPVLAAVRVAVPPAGCDESAGGRTLLARYRNDTGQA